MKDGRRSALAVLRQEILRMYPEFGKEEWAYLEKKAIYFPYGEKKVLQWKGDLQHTLAYVVQGLFRKAVWKGPGYSNNITLDFITEGEFVNDHPMYTNGQPDDYGICSLEPSIVVHLPFHLMHDGFKKFPQIEQLGRLITEKLLIRQRQQLYDEVVLTKEERYLKLLEQRTDFIQRVSFSHLASYLRCSHNELNALQKKWGG